MVTIEEAKQTIEQRRAEIEKARAGLPEVSRKELLRVPRVERRKYLSQLGLSKSQLLKAEKEIGAYEQEIAKAEKAEREYKEQTRAYELGQEKYRKAPKLVVTGRSKTTGEIITTLVPQYMIKDFKKEYKILKSFTYKPSKLADIKKYPEYALGIGKLQVQPLGETAWKLPSGEFVSAMEKPTGAEQWLVHPVSGKAIRKTLGILSQEELAQARQSRAMTTQTQTFRVKQLSPIFPVASPKETYTSRVGSSSMSPLIKAGETEVLLQKNISTESLRKGDIIEFTSPYEWNPFTHSKERIHRIVEIGKDIYGWYAKTKGDASRGIDYYTVRQEDVKGKMIGLRTGSGSSILTMSFEVPRYSRAEQITPPAFTQLPEPFKKQTKPSYDIQTIKQKVEVPKFQETFYPSVQELKKPEYIPYKLPTKEEIRRLYPSTVERYEAPKIQWSDPFPYLKSKVQSGAEQYYQRTLGEPSWSPVAQLGAGAAVAGIDIASSFRHPVESAKGTYQMVSHPIETWKSIQLSAASTPSKEYAVGYGLGLLATTYGISKVTPKIIKAQPFRYETVPLKERTLWRGIGLQIGERGYPLIGKTEKGLRIGTPKIILSAEEFKGGIIPETPIATKLITKSAFDLFPKLETKKVGLVTKVISTTQKQKSAFITQFPEETKTLSKTGVKIVKEFAKKQDAELYGTFGAKAQMPETIKGTKIPIPSDIDIQLQITQSEAIPKVQALVKQLKSSGIKARIAKGKPLLVETYDPIGKSWHHAVDIHSIDEIPDILQPSPQEYAFGFKLGQKPIKIEKIKTMPLGEQGIRKGASSITLREGYVAPAAHRMKDIPHFILTQEVLLESGKRKFSLDLFKPIKIAKAQTALGEYKQLVGFEKLATGETIKIPYSLEKASSITMPKPTLPIVSPSAISIPKPSAKVIPSTSVSISPSTKVSTYISQRLSPPSSIKVSPSSYIARVSIPKSPYVIKKVSPYKLISPSPYKTLSPYLYKSMPYKLKTYPYKSPRLIRSVSPYLYSKSVSPSPYLYKKKVIPSVPFYGKPSTYSTKLSKALYKWVKGYKAYIKRRGKWFLLAGGLAMPKAKAIKLGEQLARKTLAASFKIEPTKQFVLGVEKQYIPSKVFRAYKIRKGRRIPLEYEWIQKARYRLSMKPEVKEIQLARRRKSKRAKSIFKLKTSGGLKLW